MLDESGRDIDFVAWRLSAARAVCVSILTVALSFGAGAEF